MFPARTALNSKPAARRCSGQIVGQTMHWLEEEEEVAGYVSVEPVSLSTSQVERSESDAVLEVELMSCPVDARSKM